MATQDERDDRMDVMAGYVKKHEAEVAVLQLRVADLEDEVRGLRRDLQQIFSTGATMVAVGHLFPRTSGGTPVLDRPTTPRAMETEPVPANPVDDGAHV